MIQYRCRDGCPCLPLWKIDILLLRQTYMCMCTHVHVQVVIVDFPCHNVHVHVHVHVHVFIDKSNVHCYYHACTHGTPNSQRLVSGTVYGLPTCMYIVYVRV